MAMLLNIQLTQRQLVPHLDVVLRDGRSRGMSLLSNTSPRGLRLAESSQSERVQEEQPEAHRCERPQQRPCRPVWSAPTAVGALRGFGRRAARRALPSAASAGGSRRRPGVRPSAVSLVVDEPVAELHLDERDDHDDHEEQPGHGGGEAEVELPEGLLEQVDARRTATHPATALL